LAIYPVRWIARNGLLSSRAAGLTKRLRLLQLRIASSADPASIIVSMCFHANAEMLVRAAASSARLACTGYCAQVDQRYIEAVC
jgi:hypothetical protein